MNNKIEVQMNWDEVAALDNVVHDNPHHILGPHISEEGLIINAYVPTAVLMKVIATKTKITYDMEVTKVDGFFTLKLDTKESISYQLIAIFDNGDTITYIDPYSFKPILKEDELKLFSQGIYYKAYEKLGAHKFKQNGVEGVLFAVWAPNAKAVSVVGEFNLWDGRRHPMRKLEGGIFELFIPGLPVGELYKYEIKTSSLATIIKSDPYANQCELRPNTASIVSNLNSFEWTDKEWIKQRKKIKHTGTPMSIYELHLGAWMKPSDGREFYNYREIAEQLTQYIQKMEYTHVELMPVMEHPYDPSWGYQVTGYFAPTARYGTPEDFMYFMDYLHRNNIGVILDWVPAHFPKDAFALAQFDGTCLYEHFDKRKGEHPHWGTLIFNYGRNEVKNFLITNILYWIDKYHVDGIRMDAVASMLYLDYGREEGEWIPNIYGGNENLEAVEFLKHLNSIVKLRKDGVLMIAEESTAWPYLTHDLVGNGIGFDYKWNMGWMNDFLDYMQTDPLFRKNKHGELTFSMEYAYSEKYVLVLSHDEVVHGKGSMINKMPGDYDQKFANLRGAYGFMMAHPGKKLLFMGQEFAQFHEFDEKKSIDWELLDYDSHSKMQSYVKALNHLYQVEPALHKLDCDQKGFEWINKISADESILVFLRKTRRKEDTLLVVCNFTPVVRERYKIGVPYPGKYKEIFNSDRIEFGGAGHGNSRIKTSKKEECDERNQSIQLTVPPLGISIFKYTVPQK